MESKKEKESKRKLSPEEQKQVNDLMYAASFGYTNKVKCLIDEGVDVNAEELSGYTSLMFAALLGRITTVELLLKNKADVNAKDKFGNTVLILAAKGGCTAIVKLLLENKADVNLVSNNGETALSVATLRRNRKMKGLLKREVKRGKEALKQKSTRPWYIRFVEILRVWFVGVLVALFGGKRRGGKQPTPIMRTQTSERGFAQQQKEKVSERRPSKGQEETPRPKTCVTITVNS